MTPKPQWVEYNEEHEREFENFWNSHGEQVVLERWKEAYGDYMESENEPSNESKVIIDDRGDENHQNPQNACTVDDNTLNQESTGWGDITTCKEKSASCISNWGEASINSKVSWGGASNGTNDELQPKTVKNEYGNTDEQAVKPNVESDTKRNMTLTDEEQWNILWQEMWKSTRNEQYNEFMKNKKESTKHVPINNQTKSSDTEMNNSSKENMILNSELKDCSTHSDQEPKTELESSYFSSKTNAGVGMMLQQLQQETPEIALEKDVTTKTKEVTESIAKNSEYSQEYDDHEPPDELPLGKIRYSFWFWFGISFLMEVF